MVDSLNENMQSPSGVEKIFNSRYLDANPAIFEQDGLIIDQEDIGGVHDEAGNVTLGRSSSNVIITNNRDSPSKILQSSALLPQSYRIAVSGFNVRDQGPASTRYDAVQASQESAFTEAASVTQRKLEEDLFKMTGGLLDSVHLKQAPHNFNSNGGNQKKTISKSIEKAQQVPPLKIVQSAGIVEDHSKDDLLQKYLTTESMDHHEPEEDVSFPAPLSARYQEGDLKDFLQMKEPNAESDLANSKTSLKGLPPKSPISKIRKPFSPIPERSERTYSYEGQDDITIRQLEAVGKLQPFLNDSPNPTSNRDYLSAVKKNLSHFCDELKDIAGQFDEKIGQLSKCDEIAGSHSHKGSEAVLVVESM